MKKLLFSAAILASCAAFADASFLERPAGIKIGERLTLRPYVCFSLTIDNNADSGRNGSDSNYWTANPGLGFDYAGENWKLVGSVYYQYHAYTKNARSGELNNSSYGEQLAYSWTKAAGDGSSWSLNLSERYSFINQNDDYQDGNGRGIWRDRQQFDFSGVLERRFNEHWHASLNASWYWLDYDNKEGSYGPLYGWNRWTVGALVGCTLSQWTDVFVAGNYQGYNQDNKGLTAYKGHSTGYSAHIGVSSYMTERITYSLSAGLSQFDYGDSHSKRGFTYLGSLNWQFAETWSTMLLLSSYYHPSERELSTATRCDSISWGLAKSLVRGKLNATFDLAYRHDTTEYTGYSAADWDLNIVTARLGLNYNINRLFTVFARAEYQTEVNHGEAIGRHYDYEHVRGTLGVKLTY